ncbi:hypothetical protein QMT40_001811 [Parvibaculaceae bacterium PLY_AMNH_Bact1]|nr:hypothetical protein QMT40_001811 [Parvibaculaceae bacterium PLY_AMNH_Bact1]
MTDLVPSPQDDEMGMILPDGLSYEDWSRTALGMQTVWGKIPWVLGDVLAYGEEHFPDQWEQALKFTRRQNETLRKYMQVAKKFPHDRRRWDLSFTYYQKVAFLDPARQDELLDQAARGEINTTDLARLTRKSPVINNQRKTPDLPDERESDEDKPVMDGTAVGEAVSAERPEKRLPEQVEGQAQEVEPEGEEEPFDRVADMHKRWDKMTGAEQIAFFKWSLKRLQVVLSHEQKDLAQAVIDRVQSAEMSLANGPCEEVSERTSPVVGHEDGSAEAGVEGQPSSIPAASDRMVGAGVSGTESANASAGEVTRPSPPPAPGLDDFDEIEDMPEQLRRFPQQEPADA